MERNIVIKIVFCGIFYLCHGHGRISLNYSWKNINITEAIIVNKEWNSSLPSNLLDANITEDSNLYKDPSLYFIRRSAAKHYLDLPDWSKTVATAWKEIATGKESKISEELRQNGFYNPLSDFVEHIHYFQIVRQIMFQRGKKAVIFGKQNSSIHDVDKLHPIMLVAYAEKFEDQKDTTLWKICVDNHIAINPHHQGNSIWQSGCCSKYSDTEKSCKHCDNFCSTALLEMICDKVSRKLQKELNGIVSEDMWDVDQTFFEGLPEIWLEEAYMILKKLKR